MNSIKRLAILGTLLLALPAMGQVFSFNGDCELGGQAVITQGLKNSGTRPLSGGSTSAGSGVIASYPQCSVTVYQTGTTSKANLFSDNNLVPTPIGNPFNANSDGTFLFFAASGCYDVLLGTGSGPSMPATRTYTDVCLATSGSGGGGGGSGFANPMTTLGDSIIENSTPAAARLAGPTAPNGVPQVMASTPSAGLAQLQFWTVQGVPTNSVFLTSYTVQATDRLSYINFNNSGAIAVSLPQAGSAGFDINFVFVACDVGAGTATITPATSTISYSTGASYVSGASSLDLSTGKCAWVYSDNTNYFAILPTGPLSGATTVGGQACALGASCTITHECSDGLGDGLNAIPAGTYVVTNCFNDLGAAYTITAIRCLTDNAGTSTLNAANDAGTGLLTGAITCSPSFPSGTQSATVTIATSHWINFTFVSDGFSTRATFEVTVTR